VSSHPESRHALLVEPGGPESTAMLLHQSGYHVTRALRPTHAGSLFEHERSFAAVLCDASFPREEVVTLFGEARSRNPHCTTAVISPDSAEEDHDLAAAYDADRVIRRPLARHRWPLAAIR